MKIPLASFAAILRRLDTLERRVDALANPDRHDGDDAQDDTPEDEA